VSTIRVVVADDHDEFRSGLVRLLGLIDDVKVVGQAARGDDAVSCGLALQPDVVLMDLQMPGLDGVEATRRLQEATPHVRVLVLTMSDEDDSVFAAMRAGALGYLLKGTPREDLARAISAVARGEAIFGPAIALRMAEYFRTGRPRPTGAAFPELSDREREILALIGQGHNNAAIAQELSLSPKTVRNHVSHIFTKLRVADRAQAIVRAREAGLGGTRG